MQIMNLLTSHWSSKYYTKSIHSSFSFILLNSRITKKDERRMWWNFYPHIPIMGCNPFISDFWRIMLLFDGQSKGGGMKATSILNIFTALKLYDVQYMCHWLCVWLRLQHIQAKWILYQHQLQWKTDPEIIQVIKKK